MQTTGNLQPHARPALFPSPLQRQPLHAPANDGCTPDDRLPLHPHPGPAQHGRMFRVTDDCMSGAGICTGDMLVIRPDSHPASGEVVLARLNGQLQVRRLCRVGGEVLLLAEHPTSLPRYVLERDELALLGVVCGRFRLDLLE